MASGRDGAVLGSVRTLFGAGTSVGLDDAQLLDRFLTGREEIAGAAFETLVTRHGPMVLGVCRNARLDAHEAQDAFQATFLILARKAASIRRRDSLAGWLFGVARKVATRARSDAARRRSRERGAAVSEVVEPDPTRETEDLSALYEEIDRLPGTYRDPVILCYLDGLTYEAAARQLRCPLGTLSVRLKRARERLRSRLTRRGFAPSTLPIGGLIPGATKASVPIALTESAARVASRTTVGKATVAGAVPTSVASLAGRTMAMMRYRAIGIGSMGLGFVVLVATASLAVRATEKRPAVSEQAPKPKEARSWVRTLSNGATVELVGVSTHPTGPGTWRIPDGTPLPTAPYARSGAHAHPIEAQRAWEFAVRIGNLPEQGASRRWKVVPSGASTASGTPRDSTDKVLPGMEMLAVNLPIDRRTCTVRFGVASGGWKTEITNKLEQSAQGRMKLSAIFGNAREDRGKTFVTVSHDQSEDDLRLVAVDSDEVEHTPVRSYSSGVRDYVQLEVEFGFPLAKLKEFRLKSRPFEWVDFADVSLKPEGE